MSVKTFAQDITKFVTPSGSKDKPVFSSKVKEDGEIELIATGKEDWYGYIQSFKDSVDIHLILKAASLGDPSGLQRVQGFYADVTTVPKNNAEVLQMFIDAQNNFDALPLEIKRNFDNDFNKFFATMDSPEWFDKMKMTKRDEAAAAAAEVPVTDGEVKE